MKTGALIGVDKYGNKYFEDEKSFFGESCVSLNRGDICRTFLDYYGLIYKQILKCFCILVLKSLWYVLLSVLRTSALGDLHNRDEREENPVGCWWQYGSSRMVKSVTLQNVYANCRSNVGNFFSSFIDFGIQIWNNNDKYIFLWLKIFLRLLYDKIMLLFFLSIAQASLAALYNRWPPYHTSTRAQKVSGWCAPDQCEWQHTAVCAILHHPQEDPRVGSTQSWSSVNSVETFVNYPDSVSSLSWINLYTNIYDVRKSFLCWFVFFLSISDFSGCS